MMRKQYTSAFKAKVIQELLKEEKTLAQIASEYEVHQTPLAPTPCCTKNICVISAPGSVASSLTPPDGPAATTCDTRG